MTHMRIYIGYNRFSVCRGDCEIELVLGYLCVRCAHDKLDGGECAPHLYTYTTRSLFGASLARTQPLQ